MSDTIEMVLVDGTLVPMPPEEAAQRVADLAAAAASAGARWRDTVAAKRYAVETGGCFVAALGFWVTTDDRAQGKVTSILKAIDLGICPDPVPFKGTDGFHAVKVADMPQVFIAQAAHVAACFERELALVTAGPDAGDDIEKGWPANA